MMHPVLLLVAGLLTLVWVPNYYRHGRAPHAAVALSLLGAASVWAGSFSLVVGVVLGHHVRMVDACGLLWRALATDGLGWWQLGLLATWTVAVPGRGLSALAGSARRGWLLLAGVRSAGQPLPGGGRVLGVPGLSTPGLTLGVVRPLTLIDCVFWRTATATERAVVLAHERGHRVGRHGLLDVVMEVLTAGLSPFPPAEAAAACVRRHLEALADDAAARRHSAHTVGRTLAHVALAGAPTTGLGAGGAAVWRVRRLVTPPPPVRRWKRLPLAGVATTVLVAAFLMAVAEAAHALCPFGNTCFVPL